VIKGYDQPNVGDAAEHSIRRASEEKGALGFLSKIKVWFETEED
jgi:hypothetical protein